MTHTPRSREETKAPLAELDVSGWYWTCPYCNDGNITHDTDVWGDEGLKSTLPCTSCDKEVKVKLCDRWN